MATRIVTNDPSSTGASDPAPSSASGGGLPADRGGGRSPRIPPALLPWLVAVGSTAAALLLRLAADPFLGDRIPFSAFMAAIGLTAFLANPGATALAGALGLVAANYFFIQPRRTLGIPDASDLAAGAMFVGLGAGIAAMSAAMGRSRKRALEKAAALAAREARLQAEVEEHSKAEETWQRLSRFSTELLKAPDERAVLELTALRVSEAADGAIVGMAPYDPRDNSVVLQVLACGDGERQRMRSLLGRDPIGLRARISKETRDRWIASKLAPVPGGLFELMAEQVPREVCERFAAEAGLDGYHGLACASEDELLATGGVLSRGGPLRNQRLIESLVSQAGLALKRRLAEADLRRAEERLRLAQDLSPDAFSIFEAVRDGDGQIADFRWTFANAITAKLVATPADRLVGRCTGEVIRDAEFREAVGERYRRVVASGEPEEFEIEKSSAPASRWLRMTAVRFGDGIAAGASDISERKRTEAALRKANARLEEIDARKDDFIAALSHELRNPLAAIGSAIHVLHRLGTGDPRAAQAQAVIKRQFHLLDRLVGDLLEVSRLTRDKLQLEREKVDLNALVGHSLEDHRPQFERGGIALDFVPAPGPVTIDGDGKRLAQVVGNLLQNAAKFVGPGGKTHVSVGVDSARAMAEVRVSDTGVGIEEPLLERVFEPFAQADAGLDRRLGGLGLGLALVKGIVDLHGGSVRAFSEGRGRGAEFLVQLPLARTEARDGAAGPKPRAQPVKAARRVLLIEDNVDAAESLCEALGVDGHHVEVAHDGPSGLAKALSFRPDCVLCDIGLPGMDGYQVAREMRANPALRGLTLIALTGYAQPEDVRCAKEAGFDRHIAKPPDLDELEALLTSLPGSSA